MMEPMMRMPAPGPGMPGIPGPGPMGMPPGGMPAPGGMPRFPGLPFSGAPDMIPNQGNTTPVDSRLHTTEVMRIAPCFGTTMEPYKGASCAISLSVQYL